MLFKTSGFADADNKRTHTAIKLSCLLHSKALYSNVLRLVNRGHKVAAAVTFVVVSIPALSLQVQFICNMREIETSNPFHLRYTLYFIISYH